MPWLLTYRWRKIRVNCRQPFGTSEHRACIGLAYINFTPCHCKSNSNNSTQFPNSKNSKAKPAVTNTKRKLPSWLSSSEPDAAEELPEKTPRGSPHRNVDPKVVKSDVEEGSRNTHGVDLVDSEHGGSLKREHAESQALRGKAITLTMERSAHEGRVADSSETGEERASWRSSLKRRSSDAKETGGKETMKAKVEKESSTNVGPEVPADESKDAVLKVPTESKGARAQFPAEDKQPRQIKQSVGPEREFPKLLVGSLCKQNASILYCTSKFGICWELAFPMFECRMR